MLVDLGAEGVCRTKARGLVRRATLLVICAWSSAWAQDAVRTVAASEQAIVYGNDDRVDLYAAPERYAQLARQTAIALVGPSQLHARDDTGYSIEAPAYEQLALHGACCT